MKRLGRGSAVLLAALGAVLGLGAAAPPREPAPDEGPRCHGRTPDFVGTDGEDNIIATTERDVIWAGPGDDQVQSRLGNDLICGGPGADLLHGGRGNDTVDGGAGDNDEAIGDLGDDKVMGGTGNYDDAAGSLGIDTVNGGPGDFDLVHGDYGYDRMDGGRGVGDIASFATDVSSPNGAGVWVSLRRHKARGDGHDRLFRLENIEGSSFDDILVGNKQANVVDGGSGDDKIKGGGGRDLLRGGQGRDGCKGAKGNTESCGREHRFKASSYAALDRTRGGGGGLSIVGGGGPDDFTVAFDPASATFGVTAAKGMALGPGCIRESAVRGRCPLDGPARWLMVDLGGGDDSLRVEGSLTSIGFPRFAGGRGDDVIRGGPEDNLIEAGPGSDRLHGGRGADGLIGGLPGPTFLYGEENGDLLAAGGGCAGGKIVGGPGRDDASFAETQAHPGILYISFPRGKAWIDAVRRCKPVRLDSSNEDMEGSFDYDVLIGDSGPNAMLGQPGKDRFFGGGGDDIIDARDGVRDFSIRCGRGPVASGRAITDPFDPPGVSCAFNKHGEPVPGLNNSG